MIYSSSFVLAAFVKWFEYDSECTAYLWLNRELSWCAYCDIPNENAEADLVTAYSGSSGTCTDMLGWLPSGYMTEWWCETHVQTCSVIESKCHQCCAVMGQCNEQCVAHIPEIGSNPLQTYQSTITQPISSGLPLMQPEVITVSLITFQSSLSITFQGHY